MRHLCLAFLLVVCTAPAPADGERRRVPLHSQGSQTYYIESRIHGAGQVSMLVDTGSGYSVIDEGILGRILEKGDAVFVKHLRGIMANGSTLTVPLYHIGAITLGRQCVIRDVEAVVLPAGSRPILGISTLQKAAPFEFSFDPPALTLSDCGSPALSEPGILTIPLDQRGTNAHWSGTPRS